MRRLGAAAALVAVALLLAGCGNIPTSSNVSKQVIDRLGGDAAIPSLPDEPVAGASQQEILAGFIKAGRGSQLNYAVARDFLTADFRSKWNPNAGVLISSTPIVSSTITTNTLQIAVAVSAEVDAAGRYTSYQDAQSKPLQFTFAKDKAGQWRISSAPDGTILTPNRFASIFEAYPLYFFDPSFRYLVPDRRWFADTRPIATLIVRGLLAGPSSWLSGGVLLSAFPSGTQLIGAPVLDSGRATVNLSSEVSSESTASQRRMVQQLGQSLSQLGTFGATIMVGGFPLSIPDGATPDIQQTVLPDPIGFDKGVFGTLVNGTVRSLSGVGTAIDKLAPVGAAVGRNGTDVAVLSSVGVSVVRGTAAPVVLDRRAGLTVPSSDPEGFVWSVPVSQPGSILAYDGSGKPHSVAFSYDGNVVSLDVSRDGTRVLIALATSSGPKLLVAGIIRDKDLVPTGLGPPIYPAISSGALIDASWIDSNSVVVLSQGVGGATSIDAYDLGGESTSLGSIAGGIEVVGGNGSDGIRVLDTTGAVYSPSGSLGWQDIGQHASFLASQQ